MHKYLIEKKKYPQTSVNSRQNSNEKQIITRVLSSNKGKILSTNTAGGSIRSTIRKKQTNNIMSNNFNLANKIKNIEKIGNINHKILNNNLIPNVNINIEKNIIKKSSIKIVPKNVKSDSISNSIEQIKKTLYYNNFNKINKKHIQINNNIIKNNDKLKNNIINNIANINSGNYYSNQNCMKIINKLEPNQKEDKVIVKKKKIVLDKNNNLENNSRKISSNQNSLLNENFNKNGDINLSKEINNNRKNKFINNCEPNNNIYNNDNSLGKLEQNKNSCFKKESLISRKIMTATNSPTHLYQMKNNNNIIYKFKKNASKTQGFKKAIIYNMNNNKNNKANIINKNSGNTNLNMEISQNDNIDISRGKKTNIEASSNESTCKESSIKSRKNTTGKIKKNIQKLKNNNISNFIANNMNYRENQNNKLLNPHHNTLRSDGGSINKENSTGELKNNTSKNDNANNIKNIKNPNSKNTDNEQKYYYNNDDINENFNINNYFNEAKLKEKKINKFTEKLIKDNNKLLKINKNLKKQDNNKFLDKKKIEQLLLNKDKLAEDNNSKKLDNQLIEKNINEKDNNKKTPLTKAKAKKPTHNRNVDPNYLLNNRSNTSILSTMKDSNYYSHECEMLSKYIKEYYKQNLCYPNTDLSFYKYGRIIGRGAFGKVNIGLNVLTGRIVAIKSFNKNNILSENAKKKILYETNLMRSLFHPSVTKILETFESEKYMLIIMEYISGGNLQNFVKKRRKLCEKTSKILFRQIIQGIKYIHSKGIVHRDIKLENILLDLNNIIKICDFGVGKLIKPSTILKDQCGTPVYMAPEILKGEGYHGFPVDIWSAGVALYIMLSGALPFNKSKDHDLEYAILNINPKEIPDISQEAKNLLKNILEKDPKKRYTEDKILEHPWLNDNNDEDSYDYNSDIRNVNKYHLFTNAESILLAKTHIDYRNAQKKDLAENFTIKNLYTIDENDNKNVHTKSAILAPYNSLITEEDNSDNMNSKGSKKHKNNKISQDEKLDNFNEELKVINGIIKFNGKIREFNMNYELNNNEDIDNGYLINSKNELELVNNNEEEENKDNCSNENIYIIKKGNSHNLNIRNNKKHRPSSPYRKPPINKTFVKLVSDLGYNEDYVINCLEKNELNHATAIYYLFSNYENVK
jgi:serine/threonine protein kinase